MVANWRERRAGSTAHPRRIVPAPGLRRIVTPFRAVVLAIVAALIITGWWIARQNRLGIAEASLRESLERGKDALASGDYSTACAEYETAVSALDTLGRSDSFAGAVRQMSRQLTAMENLLPVPMEAEVAESLASPRQRDGSFAILRPGYWVVLDATIRVGVDSSGTIYEIDYPLTLDGSPITLRAHPPAFGGLDFSAGPRQVIFAARLTAIRPGAPGEPGPCVELDSESLFLWTDGGLLSHLGLEPDERTAAILTAQSEVVGVAQ